MKKMLQYLLLMLLVLIAIGPFLWLLSTALKGPNENIFQYPPQFIPHAFTLQNFVQVWQKEPLLNYFLNSFVVVGLAVVLNLVLSVLAAYPLARMRFAGQNILFYAILATMMIPFQVIMIPLYLMMLQWGLTDRSSVPGAYLGLVLPFAVSGFGIFFVRQAMVALPKELEESAVMDGCSPWQILVRVWVPLLAPTLATLAIFTFIANWGEFLWPSIVLNEPKLYTLPVGLVHLQSAFSANWRLIAAGTLIATVPIVVFFLALQRYFISGALSGSVKG